jgi:hypothetical protein
MRLIQLIGNCDPRLPAAHFQVRKEGRNKGKWFYTCQESKEDGCGFFLWDENAVGREMRAVIGNTRSEPDPSNSGVDDARHKGPNVKWIQSLGKEEGDELKEDLWDQEDVTNTTSGQPETPRKAIKANPYMTPGTKRKREEYSLVTPITTKKDDILSGPPLSRRYDGRSEVHKTFGPRDTAQTPTPNRFHDAESTGAQEESTISYDTTEEVMELLKDEHIDEETSSKLRELLNKQALRVSGIAKGRDITRVALKAKDSKIAELQQKITALNAEREMDKTIIEHFKRDVAQSIASRRGRGRGRG